MEEYTSQSAFKSFCGKIVFPALESLDIRDLDNITEIWEEHGHLDQESFCRLKVLKVKGCHKLKNVIPYAMRQRLQNLDMLDVEKCDSLISEVEGPNGAEIVEEPLVVLPKLKKLKLSSLPKLMETGLNSSDIILYPNLTTLSIVGCNNLRNVFLPSVVNNIEALNITSCKMMNEVIASLGKDSKEIRVNNIEFSMLMKLELGDLPMMNSFWDNGIVEPNLDQKKSSQTLKVSFPSLEYLIVSNCDFNEGDLFSLLGNSSWKNNPYGTTSSFQRLCRVIVDSCRLSTIFTCSVAKGLQGLYLLVVSSCGSIEEIVTDERRNDELVVEEISFPNLEYVTLLDLPNLKSFCRSANYCFKMPSLKHVIIRRCPQMLSFTPRQISTPNLDRDINSYLHPISNTQEYLEVSNCDFHEGDLFSLLGISSWKNNPYGTNISFPRLREVIVNSCRLSTIFTCSVAKALPELMFLTVRSCGSIEEIVTDERRNDELVVEEISFPNLKYVFLEDLPNLKSFCPSANYCFKMPSLRYVTISGCPQMLSFTRGKISTPSLDRDINSYLHPIRNTQELFVDKKEELKPNCVDKGKSIVTG